MTSPHPHGHRKPTDQFLPASTIWIIRLPGIGYQDSEITTPPGGQPFNEGFKPGDHDAWSSAGKPSMGRRKLAPSKSK